MSWRIAAADEQTAIFDQIRNSKQNGKVQWRQPATEYVVGYYPRVQSRFQGPHLTGLSSVRGLLPV